MISKEQIEAHLIRKEKVGAGNKWNYIYVCRCFEKDCSSEVRVSHKSKTGKCRSHSVKGAVRSELLIELQTKISHREPIGDGRHRVYLKCSTAGCTGTFRFSRKTVANGGFCVSCANSNKKGLPYADLYNKMKRRNRKYGEIMSLSEFQNLCEITQCHYCAADLRRSPYRAGGSHTVLLDRKDSKIGYTALNCVPCCANCNFTKNAWLSYEEMLLISEYRKNKKENLKWTTANLQLSKNQKS
jgi:hypothetical protein